ncbi:MAG: hypothetical protein ABIG60_01090 [Patescibacteria group bacterium]
MTLSPEQFNKLVTKDEFKEIKVDINEIKGNVRKLVTAVDGIAKKHDNFEKELISNQGAHDKFQENINSIKTYINQEKK